MRNPYFTSDTHFGHNNIRTYCPGRPGGDVIEMNEILIQNWNDRVKPNDEIFHLGDFMMGHKMYWESTLSKLNGNIHLIKGNHDKKFAKQPYVIERMVWIKDYHELTIQDPDAANGKSQLIILQHYAQMVWKDNHKGSWAFSGHSHGSLDHIHRKRLSLDVGVDAEYIGYAPISYKEVKKIMDKKNIKIVDHHGEKQ